MKNRLSLIILGFLLTTPCLLFSADGVEKHTIDFSESTNLKAVYDAGLRPWRIRPDEISTLTITNEHVSVIAPNGNAFTMSVQIGRFTVIAEHQLVSAGFNSPLMSLSEATAKVREICQALEIDTAQGAGMGSLVEKVEQLTTMGNQTPSPQYWNGRRERGADGARYSVSLQAMFGFTETWGRVLVHLDFHEPGQPMNLSTEPLTPPPGYEHMSTERPETDPTEPFPDPAYSLDAMRERMEEREGPEN